MKEIAFSEAHIFPYSSRKGTKAAAFPGQLDRKTKSNRAKKMIELSKKLHNEYVSIFTNEKAEVLFERCIGDNVYEGHMSNYICVRAKSDTDISHKFKMVKIQYVKDGIAYGELS